MDGSRHHQLQDQEQQVDLEVVGRHALLFDDDSTSAFINSSDVLVPWSGGDPSLLIDRFDARHLLQQLPLRGTLKRQLQEDNLLEPDGVSRIELDAERYRDLVNGSDGEDQQDGGDQEDEGLPLCLVIWFWEHSLSSFWYVIVKGCFRLVYVFVTSFRAIIYVSFLESS